MDAVATFGGYFLAALMAGVAAYGQFITKNVWRNVAEGRAEQITDLEKRVNALEARVDVLTDEFAEDIAVRVVERVKEKL